MSVVQVYDLQFGPSSEAEGGDAVPFTRVFGEDDFDSGFRWLDLCIVKPGAEISGHSHFMDDELYYIVQGNATKVVNGEEASVGPGDAILLRSGGSHALRNDSDGEVHVLVIDLLAPPADERRLLVRNIHAVPFLSKRSRGGTGEILVGDIFDATELGGAWDFLQCVRLPAGSAIGVHPHLKDEELYFIADGQGVMTVDGAEFAVEPGTAALCKSGSSHGLINTSGGEMTVLVVQAPVA